MSSKELPISDIISRAVVTDIPADSIIVLSVPTEMFYRDQNAMVHLYESLNAIFKDRPVLVIDDSRDPAKVLTTISEEDMNRAGWYKKE